MNFNNIILLFNCLSKYFGCFLFRFVSAYWKQVIFEKIRVNLVQFCQKQNIKNQIIEFWEGNHHFLPHMHFDQIFDSWGPNTLFAVIITMKIKSAPFKKDFHQLNIKLNSKRIQFISIFLKYLLTLAWLKVLLI